MKKSLCSMQIQPEQPLRELLFRHPHLLPMIHALGVQGPFGEDSIRQVCKNQNILEPVLMPLLDAGIYDDFELKETIPAYGLLQLCELTKTLTDYLLKHLNDFIRLKPTFIRTLELASMQLMTHRDELIQIVLPQINGIYELYYSPEYTSGKSNLLSFSIEFFPKTKLPHVSLSAMENDIEKETMKEEHNAWHSMQDFHQFLELMVALERVEERLLKPVVLQMEEDIIKTFQKKKKKPMRLAFLSLPEGELQPELLSKREKEVLSLVAQGLMNKEIADRLNISLTTVISHRKHIVSKLGITTLAGLTVYAYTHGFIITNED